LKLRLGHHTPRRGVIADADASDPRAVVARVRSNRNPVNGLSPGGSQDAFQRGHPWALSTPIEVFSLALVQGKAPARQWLVYAHSPLAERKSVKLKIPEYREVSVDVTLRGTFYLVDEQTDAVKPIK
jgi:hypothetical protein